MVMKKRYSKGTDSVDAKLTPLESVLNRNASELLGRHNIAMLNYHGNMLAKRGVDLASLPSDPTPGPSTENMLGYQMGTSMVQSDDRADLLRDADNTFYGGGTAPMPTPTPTPMPQKYKRGTDMVMRRRIGYQYGTSSVDDLNPFSTALSAAGSAMFPTPSSVPASSTVSRYRLPASNWKSHTDMATNIAKQRKALFTGAQLATQQPQATTQDDPNKPFNISSSSYKAFTDQPFSMEDRPSNISPSSYQAYLNQGGQTVHFLPPGFSTATGSTGVPGSTPNDIHFLPPGFSSVQGVTNPQSKQLQFQPPDEDRYGSAYGA